MHNLLILLDLYSIFIYIQSQKDFPPKMAMKVFGSHAKHCMAIHHYAQRIQRSDLTQTLDSLLENQRMTKTSAKKDLEQKIGAFDEELKLRIDNRTKEMELKIKSLEEINKGMDALLNKKERDKNEIENNIVSNVNMLIKPYLEKIKKTKLDDRQKVLVDILESNIDEIISPFYRKMSMKELNLTPMEIQIANLIIQGASSKKIGKIIKISSRTVDTHRKNIRKKIGLDQKRANLRSYLLALC